MDDENKETQDIGITDTGWMEGSTLNEISGAWSEVKEGVPGYGNTRGSRLAAALAHLTSCDYAVSLKRKCEEIERDPFNMTLQAELRVIQSKMEVADKITDEILEGDYFYADPADVLSGRDEEVEGSPLFWMERSVFEEIFNALRQGLYSPIVKPKIQGVKWEHFGYLTPLQKAAYHVTNEYARAIKKMGSEGLIADGKFPSIESIWKRRVMESRFTVAGTFFACLIREATVSLTGRYAIIFTACDEIQYTRQVDEIMRIN